MRGVRPLEESRTGFSGDRMREVSRVVRIEHGLKDTIRDWEESGKGKTRELGSDNELSYTKEI